MEVLLGMGAIQGILTVLVNDIEIPQGVNGVNMTSTGWYNLITPGTRNGAAGREFHATASGVPLGDPYGSMAYLSVVVPNRINDGTSIPTVQVLMQGLQLWQFDTSGNFLGEQFSEQSGVGPAGYPDALRVHARRNRYRRVSPTAAAYADELISVDDPVGGSVQLPRFQCNFALKDSQSAGEIIRSIRNGSRFYLVLNTRRVCSKRGSRIPSRCSNRRCRREAMRVNTFNGGWPAYEFDATSIARNKRRQRERKTVEAGRAGYAESAVDRVSGQLQPVSAGQPVAGR